MTAYTTAALTPETWDAFAALVDANNGEETVRVR